jgi:hypothetical protein
VRAHLKEQPTTTKQKVVKLHLLKTPLSWRKMNWLAQSFHDTLDSRDYAALNSAYLHQGSAAH